MSSLTFQDMYEQFTRSRIVALAKDPDYTGTVISSGSLTIEKRYQFITAGTSANFGNVGFTGTIAAGQFFYATASVAPTSWGSPAATIYCGQLPSDIVENEIENTRLKFAAIAEFCGATFTEDSATEIGMAMKYYTMYLLYVRSQNEKQGETERDIAIGILTELWGENVNTYLSGQAKSEGTDESLREKIATVDNIDYSEDDIEDWD
jgi:hypothetical protein